MGAVASSTLAGQVERDSTDLRNVLQGLPHATKAKLRAALEPALHVTLIVWNFKDMEKCKPWLDNFKTVSGGALLYFA